MKLEGRFYDVDSSITINDEPFVIVYNKQGDVVLGSVVWDEEWNWDADRLARTAARIAFTNCGLPQSSHIDSEGGARQCGHENIRMALAYNVLDVPLQQMDGVQGEAASYLHSPLIQEYLAGLENNCSEYHSRFKEDEDFLKHYLKKASERLTLVERLTIARHPQHLDGTATRGFYFTWKKHGIAPRKRESPKFVTKRRA